MKTTKLLLALGLALGTTAAFAQQTTPAPAAATPAPATTPAPADNTMAGMGTAKPMHKHHRHHRRHRHHKAAAKKVNDHDKDDATKTDTSSDANKGS